LYFFIVVAVVFQLKAVLNRERFLQAKVAASPDENKLQNACFTVRQRLKPSPLSRRPLYSV